MPEALKPLIDLLIKSVEESDKKAETSDAAILQKIDKIMIAMEKQNLFSMEAGTIVSSNSCMLHAGNLQKKIDEHKASTNSKLNWTWIVFGFIVTPIGGGVVWLGDIILTHFKP